MPIAAVLRPSSVDEACQLLAATPTSATAVAGGVGLVPLLRSGTIAPERLVSLVNLEALRGITPREGSVRIGACSTLTEVATSPLIRAFLPSLADACLRVGNVRIRNAGTLGGNLLEAHFASDPPTVLVNLGATCRLVSATGRERTITAEHLFSEAQAKLSTTGELLVDIIIPTRVKNRSVYLKYVSLTAIDRPSVGVAARATIDDGIVTDADVAVGAVARTPQRFPDVNAMLVGRPLTEIVVRQAAAEIGRLLTAVDDIRATAWYRRQIADVLVRRALAALADLADDPHA